MEMSAIWLGKWWSGQTPNCKCHNFFPFLFWPSPRNEYCSNAEIQGSRTLWDFGPPPYPQISLSAWYCPLTVVHLRNILRKFVKRWGKKVVGSSELFTQETHSSSSNCLNLRFNRTLAIAPNYGRHWRVQVWTKLKNFWGTSQEEYLNWGNWFTSRG